MRRGHRTVPVLLGELLRATVAHLPRPRLKVGPGERPLEPHHVKLDPGGRTAALHDLTVPRGAGAAHAVVHVQRGEREAEREAAVEAQQELEHDHGVGAAGEHEEHALTGLDHALSLQNEATRC